MLDFPERSSDVNTNNSDAFKILKCFISHLKWLWSAVCPRRWGESRRIQNFQVNFFDFSQVIKICRPFIVEDEILKLCAGKFVDFIDKSLTLEFAHRSALKCRPTHILDFPDGSGMLILVSMRSSSWWAISSAERGSALGLDISGKTFRLVHVRLHGDRICEVTSRLYEVPQSKLIGSGFKVVEYVARCVANFVETSDVDREEKTILGVSIGFPIEQESLQEAKLLEWSNEFRCDDFINEDFFVQLKLALKKYRVC